MYMNVTVDGSRQQTSRSKDMLRNLTDDRYIYRACCTPVTNTRHILIRPYDTQHETTPQTGEFARLVSCTARRQEEQQEQRALA